MFAMPVWVRMQVDLCSLSSSKLFSLHMHESNSNQSQLKLIIHPAMKYRMGSWYTVRLADSTEQTWACWSASDPHPEGRGPHQKIHTQTEALAVPRASCPTCMCTLQFCCVKSPADFHTVQTLSPGRQWCSFSHPQPAVHHAPAEPSEHNCQPAITLPACSLHTTPGSVLSQSPLSELQPRCGSPHPLERAKW